VILVPRRLKTWLAVALGSALLATAIFVGYGYYLRWEARELLNDVFALTSASNTNNPFALLRQKYGDRMTAVACSGELCSYQMTVSNHLLSALPRIPYTELNVRFEQPSKPFYLVIVDYRSALSHGNSPAVHVQTDFCTANCGNFDMFYVHPWDQSSTPERWSGSIEMGHTTTSELRQAALSLNTDCLTRIHGCTDIAQLLPEVWRPSEDGIRCVLANRTGRVRPSQ